MGGLCGTLQYYTANGAAPFGPYGDLYGSGGSQYLLDHESSRCLTGATTCGEVTSCMQVTPAEIAACAGKSTSQCQGDVLVGCDPSVPSAPATFYDCTQDGQHCFQGASAAACGTGTCDPGTTSPSCQGKLLVSCVSIGTAAEPSGVLVPTDCSKQYGWDIDLSEGDGCDEAQCTSLYADTCGVAAGVAQCLGSGGACPNDFVASCSGTVVSSCTAGTVAHFDCASLGPYTCKDSGVPGFPDCVAAATECTGYGNEGCADGVISFCLNGTNATLDCKSYGLSGCTTVGMFAGCTP
jgi:hypothetical protein